MKTLLAAAALGLTALSFGPALADPIADANRGWSERTHEGRYYGEANGWGYDDGARYNEGYRHNSAYGWSDPAWRSGASQIAICPPGYHLGRDARLCWPD